MSLPVSVIIPTYNRAHLVGRAITAALEETLPGDEVIVVDDGSTDSTDKVLRSFGDWIVYIRKENGGSGSARNRGVREAKNPLIAFLDSDDEWMPGKIEAQRQLMQARPDVLFCFSDFAVTRNGNSPAHNFLRSWLQDNPVYWQGDQRGWNEILGRGTPFSSICPLPPATEDFRVYFGNLYPQLLRAPYVFTCTLMVRRAEAAESLFFDEDVRIWEEWLCASRLAQKGTAAFMETETAWQHDHPGPRMMRADEMVCVNTRIEMLQRVWGRDTRFLNEFSDFYNQILAERYCHKAAVLIRMGHMKEARETLKLVKYAPASSQRRMLELTSRMPGMLVQAMVLLRRSLKGAAR